jgi:ATP/maltotriose-dependent transcriptional regulator MalT/DNA-binding SARP family transcriptional activator
VASLAKLTRPKLHKVVQRDRVYGYFDEARSRPLVWVTSPPGSGKTTAVASYLEANKVRTLWYQIDSGDRDLASFFYYLSLAVEPHGGKRKQSLPLLTPDYLADIPAYARHYFRLFYGWLKAPAVLVLDNYHELPADSILHGLLEQAILEAPEGINVVVISRMEPHPECARLEATDRLSRIGYETLKLTLEEAREIAALRYDVDEATLQLLHAHSAGWVAGLTLTLERMKRLGSPGQELRGEALESVFDYFARQILRSVNPEVKDFLLRCALLPSMTATMAQQLSGNSNAAALLDDLYRQRLFTDRRGADYQFHDLFRAFLLEQFGHVYTVIEQKNMRRQAGLLLEEAQQFEKAFNLYGDAQDWESIIRLILGNADQLLTQGRGETLRGWIGSLPAAVAETNPWIDYWLGMSLIAIDPVGARRRLEHAYNKFDETKDRSDALLSACAVINSYAFEATRFAPLDPWAQRIAQLIEAAPAFVSAAAELNANAALLFIQVHRRPDPDSSERNIDRILHLLDVELRPDAKMPAAHILLHFFFHAQQADRARALIRQIETLIVRGGISPGYRMLWLEAEGWFWAQSFDLQEAWRAFDSALEVGRANALTLPFQTDRSYYGLAWYSLQRGDLAEAGTYLSHTSTMLDPSRPLDAWLGHMVKTVLALQSGDFDGALRSANVAYAAAQATEVGVFQLTASGYLAIALIELGRHDEAEVLLDAGRNWVEGTAYKRRRSEIDFVGAFSALRRGDLPACRGQLRRALTPSRQGDCGLGTLVYRRMLAELMAVALTEGIEADYVRRIIRLAKLAPPTPEFDPWPWPLKIRTLGRFELLRDDVPVAFPHKTPKKPLQLLKALVAFGGTDVPVHKLTDALWPELAGDQARNAFSIALNRLRKLLDDADSIVLGDAVLGIDATHLWVDVTAFQCLTERLPNDNPSVVGSRVKQAMELYRGNFLEDEEDASWAVALRERLRTKFIRLVSDQAADRERVGDYQAAAAVYQRGIAADELTEEFYRGLMRCYAAQDRKAEAMGVFRRLRQTLSVTLAIAPSAASQALFDSLRP